MKAIRVLLEEKLKYYRKIYNAAMEEFSQNNTKGNIRVCKRKNSYQYYLCEKKGENNGKYIKKENRDVACKIAQRDYNKEIIKEAEKKIKWIEITLKTMPEKRLWEIYETSSGRKPLIKPYEISDEEYIAIWKGKHYIGKAFDEKNPEIYTEQGERVRSKSEKLIADKLYLMNIPYKYECPVVLKGYGTVYPDFTLLNIKRRQEIILEHFGIMDNPEYANKAIRKINLYTQNGYILGENLLLSFETSETVTDMRTLEKQLRRMDIVENNAKLYNVVR